MILEFNADDCRDLAYALAPRLVPDSPPSLLRLLGALSLAATDDRTSLRVELQSSRPGEPAEEPARPTVSPPEPEPDPFGGWLPKRGRPRLENATAFLDHIGTAESTANVARALCCSTRQARVALSLGVRKETIERVAGGRWRLRVGPAPEAPTPARVSPPAKPTKKAKRKREKVVRTAMGWDLAKYAGRTRAHQGAAYLELAGGEVHQSELAAALQTSVGNVNNVIRSMVDHGLAIRVGGRSGRVRLAEQRPPGPPPKLSGLSARVFGRLQAAGANARSAKGIAGELGNRPREIGNALSELVEQGIALRIPGDGTPTSPARYRLAAGR